MILALDISTSITGVTLLDKEGNRIFTGYTDTRKEIGFFNKVEKQKNEILNIIEVHCGDNNKFIERIFIEQSLQAFRPGLSSAKVILALAGMNRTLSYLLYEALGLEPEYIGASTARKACGIKIPKGEKAKKVVLQFLLDNEADSMVEYTSFGNPKAPYYDMADSIVIARAGYEIWKSKNSDS